jgi:penicillin-binding protein 1C
MLANRSELAPLRYQGVPSEQPRARLLSEEASFMTLEMLKSTPRPEDAFARRKDRVLPAWKTGTSWGFRDAWTAGVFGPYVLVVWVGNFDGSGNPAFVGVQAAAPWFFRVTDARLAGDPMLMEPVRRSPLRLARVEVCSASGDLPNAECPQTTQTWYVPGVSPIRISQIHRRLWIDMRSGRQACPPYDAAQTIAAAPTAVSCTWPWCGERWQAAALNGLPRSRSTRLNRSSVRCWIGRRQGRLNVTLVCS